MSDYTKVYDGAAKDTAQSVLSGADFDTEFDAIETAIATKQDAVASPTTNGIALLDASGQVIDSANVVKDASGNEIVEFNTETTPVNYLILTASATGNGVDIAAAGDDTNIDINLTPKGSGSVTGVTSNEFTVVTDSATQYEVIDSSLSSDVKRIEIILDHTYCASGNNSGYIGVQFYASAAWVTTGYTNHCGFDGDPNAGSGMGLSSGLNIGGLHNCELTAGALRRGVITLDKVDGVGDWCYKAWLHDPGTTEGSWSHGYIDLGAAATQIRLVSVVGDVFEGGGVRVRYYG